MNAWRGAARLLDMDSARFGRALGIGARLAAKTVAEAVDAAAAPNPSAAARPDSDQTIAAGSSLGQQAGRVAAQKTIQAKNAGRGVVRGGKRFGEAVWGPVVKLSGVLWLEFTGVFFGIFALYAASGVWKLRGDLRETATNHDDHVHLLLAAGMAVLFGYFCVTSFLRAGRRGRTR